MVSIRDLYLLREIMGSSLGVKRLLLGRSSSICRQIECRIQNRSKGQNDSKVQPHVPSTVENAASLLQNQDRNSFYNLEYTALFTFPTPLMHI